MVLRADWVFKPLLEPRGFFTGFKGKKYRIKRYFRFLEAEKAIFKIVLERWQIRLDKIVKDKNISQGVDSCCKTAEWLDRYYVLVCSNCGEVVVHDSDYCPSCGARMKE